MKVAVCLKHVPDTTELRFSPETGELLVRGVVTKISDYDRYAVEAAARLQEGAAATVTLVCFGPAEAGRTVKEALARGAGAAILVADPAASTADPLTTARVLAAAVGRVGPVDLVLCGDVSEDGYHGLVPGMLAAVLGVPHVGAASGLEVVAGEAVVTRVADGARERYRVPLPAVISVSRAIDEPRAVTALQVMKVPLSRITTLSLADLGVDREALVPGRAATRMVGLRSAAVPRRNEILTGEPDAVVLQLVDALAAMGVLQ